MRRVRRATSASASGTARSGVCASVMEQLEPYSFLLVLKAASGAVRAYLKPYIALERPRSRNRLLMLGEQSLAPLETIRTNGTASPFNACFDLEKLGRNPWVVPRPTHGNPISHTHIEMKKLDNVYAIMVHSLSSFNFEREGHGYGRRKKPSYALRRPESERRVESASSCAWSIGISLYFVSCYAAKGGTSSRIKQIKNAPQLGGERGNNRQERLYHG